MKWVLTAFVALLTACSIHNAPRSPVDFDQSGPTATQGEWIYVRGEVKHPGFHAWLTDLDVLGAINLAGGLTEYAGNRISVDRENETVFRATFRELESLQVNPPKLKSGDIVSVWMD